MDIFRGMNMKKFIVILMALALAMASLTACAGKPAQPSDSSKEFLKTITPETATASGECGDYLNWYYKDGVLVIKGTGTMTNYYSDAFEDSYAPWVTYNDGEIKDEISLVIIGDGATSVGDLAFYGLDFLSKAVLPDTLEIIGEGAFFGCEKLISVNFPESLKTIENWAFSGCESLTSVNFPEYLEIIGESVFSSCALTSVSLPESLKEIGYEAFKGCRSLTSLSFSASLEKIGNSAFGECGLTDIVLPEGIKRINYLAFDQTESVTVPVSIAKIDGFGYQNEITFLGDAPEIATWEVYNSDMDTIGVAIVGLNSGFMHDDETQMYIDEPEETGVTIYYSGKGFEKYIEMCPQYNWVKK